MGRNKGTCLPTLSTGNREGRIDSVCALMLFIISAEITPVASSSGPLAVMGVSGC